MMKKIFAFAVILAGSVALMLVAGCATTSEYVDSSNTTVAVKNLDRMSSSDWVLITQEAGNALLSSPLFAEYLEAYSIDAKKALQKAEAAGEEITTREKLTRQKPLLMLSTIQNNTSEHIDSKLMTERLREILFNSGKVRFTTYAAGEGQIVDAATAGARELQRDPNVKKSSLMKKNQVNAYDLTLGGAIIKQTAQSGRDNELSYTFTLTLTDSRTGEGVWAYTKEIKRQHKQGVFGW